MLSPMENWPRHRLVTSAQRAVLEKAVAQLEAEGWRRLGDPAMAMPRNPKRLPYWSQAMYCCGAELHVEPFDADVELTSSAA